MLLPYRHQPRGPGKKSNKDPGVVGSGGLPTDSNQNPQFFSFDPQPQPTYVRVCCLFGWSVRLTRL
jgi:hypothetical protein